METLLRPTNESTSRTSPPPRRPQQAEPPQRDPAARRYGGMHLRRDKRFPLSRQATIGATELVPAPMTTILPLEIDALKSWKEAVMLWLSWNSDHEKLTEKMCKPEQDQNKLEALMDEMDLLRRQAIDLSERLLRE